MLHGDSFDPNRPDRKGIGVVKLDLRTVQPALSALRADVREDAVHLLLGLAHRVALHNLANAPASAAVRPGIRRIARDHRAVQGVEPPDVVKSRDMIHVRMRENDGIHLVDAVLDTRKAHFGRRVNQERRGFRTHVSAAPAALIARICRGADLAFAADLRNPDARSSS